MRVSIYPEVFAKGKSEGKHKLTFLILHDIVNPT